jgi:predicted negative regulator of RcsB-dependent stress response
MSDPVTSIESTVYAKAKEAVIAEFTKLEPIVKSRVSAFAQGVVAVLEAKQKAAEAVAAKLLAEAEAKLPGKAKS